MSYLDKELYNAVYREDIVNVEDLIARGASVNYQVDYSGSTPLHKAAKNKNVEVTESLIRNKANVNAADNDGSTPLHKAANYTNVEIIDILIKNKANVNATDKKGYTPLHKAARNTNVEVTDILIRNKANVNAADNDGDTPLHKAVDIYYCQRDMVEKLICLGANVSASNKKGATPLHKAAAYGHVGIIDILIKNNAEVNATDSYEKTPLNSFEDHLQDENQYTKDKKDDSPLHQAVRKKDENVVKALISLGANLSAVNNMGATPLHNAAADGHVEITDILIRNNAEVNATDSYGATPLHKAAAHGHVEILDILIKNNAEVNATDNNGDSVLHQAASEGNEKAVNVLVIFEANLSAINKQGDTPLHQVARDGKKTTVENLVRLGANISATNNKGKSPLQLLEQRCMNSLWYKKVAKGGLLLHEAVRYGKQDIVKALLCLGANSTERNDQGETPYDLAKYGYRQNEYNAHATHYEMIVNYLKEKTDTLNETREHLSVTSKKYTAANSDTSALPKLIQSDKTKEKDVQLPWLVDADDFHSMLSHGTYLSYENRLSLGGPCRAGKSTLASVLIGEEIPLKWDSTDGLVIFFGRNGIDIEKKKMVPLKEGERGHEVLAKILRGEPDVGKNSGQENRQITTTRANPTVPIHKQTSVLPNRDTHAGNLTAKYEIDKFVTKTDTSVHKHVMEHVSTHIMSTRTKNIQTMEYQKLQLKSDILEEVRNGQYQIKIAPSDLIDFGGQKSYDMTHQLFIQHGGSFLMMFDGRFGLHEQLQEYPEGNTAASILTHWVNSILTYTEDTDDIMPMIMFAATHRDQIKCDTVKLREQFITDIKQLFSGHEQKHHIHLETVYFINGLDKNDVEIQHMTDQVVMFAMQQSSWGQRRPMQWVPLELQISKMRMKNINIITKENLQGVNMQNEDLALREDQLNDFLLVQHSLGKLMYYHLSGLDNCIVIHPPALVNILRSFVTDEKFFPADHKLKSILQNLTATGKIYKKDLLLLWQQDDVHQFMPNDSIKEFVVQLLIHLDILIVPKVFAENHCIADLYIVPCMIKSNKPPSFSSLDSQGERTICLKYSLDRHSIPSSLAYKLIGAAIKVWPLKEEGTESCLYHKAAVLNVGEDSELRICLEGNQVKVYMVNQKSLLSISPDVAASVKDCLTRSLESSLLFYYNSFGRTTNLTRVSELYKMEFGIPCGSGYCFISSLEVTKIDKWTCINGKEHNTKYVRYWVFDKSQKTCGVGCTGLTDIELQKEPSDKHLVRLGSQIEYSIFREFFLNLGMELEKWHNTESTYAAHSSEGIRSMALHKWKEFHLSQKKKPTLKDLSDALIKVNLDSHLICQILRETVELLELNLDAIPNDQHLKELSNQIGNCPVQLGIELGLSFTEVEQSLYRFPKDLPGLMEDILTKWKAKSKVKTIYSLMMALQQVDADGVGYLRDIAKNSDPK